MGKLLGKRKLTVEEVANDIESNRNHSWIKEIISRHKNEMGRVVINYFGKKITVEEFVSESKSAAKSLSMLGVKQGDKIVICVDRIPEYVYLIGAASYLGLNIKIVSEKFEQSYLESIVKNSHSSIFFVQDNKFDKIGDLVSKLSEQGINIVTVSAKRSLPKPNPYYEIASKFYDFGNDLNGNHYMDYDEFLTRADMYDCDLKMADVSLDDPFITSYSSGTTRKGHPKGITHSVKHYTTMGRYHDPEVSGVPSLKNFRTYSNIPAFSNTFIESTLSDNLIMGGEIELDPIDDPRYFFIGAKIHKGNMNVGAISAYIYGALDFYDGDKYGIHSLPDAMFNFAGGEEVSAGEEKFLNKFFRDVKAGTNISHTSFSIAKLCTAGADCEHGSLFHTIFRAYYNKAPYRIGRSEPIGMKPYDFVKYRVLRPDGTHCGPLEHGRLVAKSACDMIEYDGEPEETRNFYIKDAYGDVLGDMNVWGYYDEHGYVTMKGRITNDGSIPCYRIADEILKDTKKIMTCVVVPVKDGDSFVYVAHIMPQYGVSFNKDAVINSAIERCKKKFGNGIENIVYFRIHTLEERMPLKDSGKRDYQAMASEGLERVEPQLYNKKVPTRERVRK